MEAVLFLSSSPDSEERQWTVAKSNNRGRQSEKRKGGRGRGGEEGKRISRPAREHHARYRADSNARGETTAISRETCVYTFRCARARARVNGKFRWRLAEIDTKTRASWENSLRIPI